VKDHRDRRIRRRDRLLEAWEDLVDLAAGAPAAFIRRQMRALQDEIRALRRG
jgi:hypothetical protein